jgi:hypothetical protein
MKKTVIAMAVAAALPITAQADSHLSGSVKASYDLTSKALDIDSDLDIAITEVLANGMTATASVDLSDGDNAGKASLEGDFGTLTVDSGMDRDGAFQSGVLVPVVAELYETADTASTANAIHYSGSMAGLNVQAQANASSTASGAAADTQASANQFAVTYDFNGINLGYATVDSDMTSGVGKTISNGNAVSATYSLGEVSVGDGKASTSDDSVMMASYETTYGDVDLTASVYNWGGSSSTYGSASYTLDGLTVALNYDSDKGVSGSKGIAAGSKTSTVTATYVAGDMTAKVNTQFDGSTDYSVALDLGNSDLSLERDDSDSKTTAKYSVAF